MCMCMCGCHVRRVGQTEKQEEGRREEETSVRRQTRVTAWASGAFSRGNHSNTQQRDIQRASSDERRRRDEGIALAKKKIRRTSVASVICCVCVREHECL